MKSVKLFSLSLVLAAAPAFASTLYTVSIDTTSLSSGTTGYIDLAFNGGYPATATISGFSNPGGALDIASLYTQGTVSGTLPGTVTMGNDNSDYDEGITFGSPITFVLELAGLPSGSVGDVFTLSFYNSDFSGGLLTGNNNDFWLAQWQMDLDGNITPSAYANPSGGASYADISLITPEPASAILLLAGLCIPVLRRRSR